MYHDILPVGSPSGIQEITVYVVFLVREVGFCRNVDHPWSAVATHTQMQRVEAGPIVMLLPIKWSLEEEM